MTLPSSLAPGLHAPGRAALAAGLAVLLGLDLLLLATLDRSPLALAGAVAVVAFFLLARDLPLSLALALAGAPLLDPVAILLQDEQPVLLAVRLALMAALLVSLLLRVERPGSLAARTLLEPAWLFALGLWVVLILGAIDTPSPGYARLKVINYVLNDLLFFLAGAVIASSWTDGGDRRVDRRLDRLARLAVAFCLAIAAAGLLNAQIGYYRYEGRLRTLGMNPIWLARTMGLGLLLLFGLWRARGIRARAAALLGLPLALVLLLTGSRGPILGVPAAGAAFWMLRGVGGGRRAGLRLALALAAVLALLPLALPQAVRDRFLHPGSDVSDLFRLRMAQIALEAVGEAPLAGIGTGGFSHLLRMGDVRAYPHNIVAEVLIENGLLGLLLLLGLLAVTFARGLVQRSDPRGMTFFLVFLYALWNALLSGDITSNEWIWLAAGILAGRRA